ncbi:translation initiation factor IF-2 [Dysgonomonas sp. 25]|uniref:translation initiation factor IF-2 n=1 Tax=Dysgonomonas sp. 25 TaxID=2302933 RepID=UPI0013D134A9|nr:translation initiation factor IF-2 [Dysgonomonas sp. 25]NDV67828.1 translation initiation factor IF-2 [Dysgonomonas sp. 25]
MSIRLIKISKDLNVGISTIVDYLHSKGIQVESNPNTKIENEHYEMLVREFGKDQDVQALLKKKEAKEAEKAAKEEAKAKEAERKKQEEAKAAEVIKTEIPEDKKPHVQIVDKIDLDALNKPKKKAEEPTPAKEEPVVEKQPVAEKEVTPAKPAKEEAQPEVIPSAPEKEETGEGEVFRLDSPTITNQIVVKGTIDLSAINDKTRPAKKSKAEKKKERMEREAQDQKKVKDGAVRLLKKEAVDEQKKKADEDDENAKKKRNRIKKGKVDLDKGMVPSGATLNKSADRNKAHGNGRKPIIKAGVSEEEVQKQIKETLARLTSKGGKSKGSKYRKEKREAVSQRYQEELAQQEAENKILKITEFVTANDLANMMNVPVVKVISTCMSIGIMVSINQRLDAETINIVAEEFGFKTEYVSAEVVEAISDEEDNEEDLEPRAPIVTVMGHVDHGKTSLLDNIRQTNVIAGEAGGITQHIGAYNVKLKSGRRITFLDTPGHEAFTAMRARGAKVTDIAIIIVAADDNVMPQTIEAINHASAAGVPIVFAINKIDKQGANPDKIKETLAGMNYLVEEWGGKYQSQDISAKQGLGVEELLEKVLLEADILELKANPKRRALGSIIESSLDKGRGYVSTVLVQNGTLRKGDVVLAGTHFGRVKAMFNERNMPIEEATPAAPALILGLSGAPQAGDIFNVIETEQEAREIANKREQLQREQGLRTQKLLTLDDIGRRIAIGNFQQLNVIVKGDVDGSVEALADSLIRLSTEEIQVNVIHKAVGQISESDVTLAAASDAIIIGFQVRPSQAARRSAEKEGVDIRLYSIIYDAIDEVKSAMEGMLSPEIKEVYGGTAEVQEVFKITKVGTIAGCIVKEGKIKRSNKVRVIRDGIVIHTGELGSLKRFKDDVKEVVAGLECGLDIHNFNDIKVGDMIESFDEIEVKKTL